MEFNRLLSSAISVYGEPNLDSVEISQKPKQNQKKIDKKEYHLITDPEEIDSWIKEAEEMGGDHRDPVRRRTGTPGYLRLGG